MAVRLIISDVDGCLSPEESVAWDLGRFSELCRLSQQASAGQIALAPMTLCTGRPQPYVEALMKIMDIRFPAICENGAVIYELSSNRAEYAPGVTPEKVTGLRAVRCFIEEQILPQYPQAVIQFGKEAQLSVFSKEPAIFERMRGQILDFVAKRGGPELVINASHFYLNISLAKLDKGSAIRHVLELANLKKHEVAGIGDTVGDLPLRNEVAFFACPANATPEIKAVADYVSPHANLPGVLDILTQAPLRRM
jgi:HAD superfamily hydrolase (TIGR01484 family)